VLWEARKSVNDEAGAATIDLFLGMATGDLPADLAGGTFRWTARFATYAPLRLCTIPPARGWWEKKPGAGRR